MRRPSLQSAEQRAGIVAAEIDRDAACRLVAEVHAGRRICAGAFDPVGPGGCGGGVGVRDHGAGVGGFAVDAVGAAPGDGVVLIVVVGTDRACGSWVGL